MKLWRLRSTKLNRNTNSTQIPAKHYNFLLLKTTGDNIPGWAEITRTTNFNAKPAHSYHVTKMSNSDVSTSAINREHSA